MYVVTTVATLSTLLSCLDLIFIDETLSFIFEKNETQHGGLKTKSCVEISEDASVLCISSIEINNSIFKSTHCRKLLPGPKIVLNLTHRVSRSFKYQTDMRMEHESKSKLDT